MIDNFTNYENADRVTLVNSDWGEQTEVTGKVKEEAGRLAVHSGQMPDWPVRSVVASVDGDVVLDGRIFHATTHVVGMHGKFAVLEVGKG